MTKAEFFRTLKLLWPLLTAIAIVLLVCLVVEMIQQSQRSNQIVRPLPGTAPVAPALPQLVSYLRGAKSICESRAQAAKGRHPPLPSAQLDNGRRLYDSTKSEFDGAIAFLRTALARRFIDTDPAQISALLTRADGNMREFLDWSEQPLGPLAFGKSPLADAIIILDGWLRSVAEQNQKAIEMIREELKSCELANWKDL
jgi:hypothetical protein